MLDLWFYGIFNFLKKGRGRSNLRKIRAIVLKLHTNILYRLRNFGIESGQNRWKRSNVFRFLIFWKFSENYLTQSNFDLSTCNFARKRTNTEWCLILNFSAEIRSRIMRISRLFESNGSDASDSDIRIIRIWSFGFGYPDVRIFG